MSQHPHQDEPEMTPETPALRLVRLALQLAADGAGAPNKCDRRQCRKSRMCQAEGILEDRLAYCAQHWSIADRQRFWHMAGFALFLTDTPVPEGCSPKDAAAIWELVHGFKWEPHHTRWIGLLAHHFSDSDRASTHLEA
jgi:hypothetical protein